MEEIVSHYALALAEDSYDRHNFILRAKNEMKWKGFRCLKITEKRAVIYDSYFCSSFNHDQLFLVEMVIWM